LWSPAVGLLAVIPEEYAAAHLRDDRGGRRTLPGDPAI